MSFKLTKIEPEILDQHPLLTESDNCYFFGEYTAYQDHNFSLVNSLIKNIKKKPSTKHTSGYGYKERDIGRISKFLSGTFNPAWLRTATLVPIPPSRIKTDPEYDDRILRILNGMTADFPLDIRELLFQTQTTRASHESGDNRVSTDELRGILQVDTSLSNPPPTNIALFDDVLTAGKHYSVCKEKLLKAFPHAKIYGFFLARTVRLQD